MKIIKDSICCKKKEIEKQTGGDPVNNLSSVTKSEVVVNTNYDTRTVMNICKCINENLDEILKEYNIDYSHFTGRAKSYKTNYVKAENYFDNNKFIKAYQLKKKLLKEKIKENKCEICGLSTWLDYEIPLELHHLDGNHWNNELDNL